MDLAEIRALEVDSALRLSLEGGYHFLADTQKLDGYEYCSRSVTLSDRGEYRPSIREASKALYLGEASGDDYLLAHANRDLAYAYSFAGQLAQARHFAEMAIKHVEHVQSDRGPILGRAHKILGDLHRRQGFYDEAIASYRRALRTGGSTMFPEIASSIAYANLAAGDLELAKESFNQAANWQAGSLQPIILRGLAEVASAAGRHRQAIQLYKRAAGSADGEDYAYHRLWALTGTARSLVALGDLDAALRHYLDALLIADKLRGRFRSEEFKAGFFAEIQGVFDEAIGLLFTLGHTEDAFEISERSRARALLDLLHGRVTLTERSRAYIDSFAGPVSLPELRDALSENVVLVVYHLSEEQTYAWVIRRSGMQTIRLPESRQALNLAVIEFRQLVTARAAKLEALAADLYARLIAPLTLAPEEVLVIVPHDTLHYLPFQALRGQGAYLIEERALSYVPSASAFVVLAQRPKPRRSSLIAFGNPGLDLPGAEREVASIGELFRDSGVYLRGDATKPRFFALGPESDVLHIAAHARIDRADPLYSTIEFAPSENSDGVLEAHEIYAIDLSTTALVSLSACETALGRVSRGDELWGFTRTFFGAGVSAILVSLWPVSDGATEKLMTEFFSSLGSFSAQEAIRHAQLSLIADKELNAPLYWASFNLLGDPR